MKNTIIILLLALLSSNLAAQSTQNIEQENRKRSTVEHGVLKLANGETIEGKFSEVDFRQSIQGKPWQDGELDLTFTLGGASIAYHYTNEKGKNKKRYYKEKQIDSFTIVLPNGENELYVNLTYLDEPIGSKQELEEDSQDDEPSFSFNIGRGEASSPKEKSKLVYQALDNSGLTVYTSDKDIFIKNKTTNKAIKLNKSRLALQLKELASDCPAIHLDVDSGAFRYTIESICQFADQLDICP